MKKFSPLSFWLFIFCISIYSQAGAQNVGVNSTGSSPHPSAGLDVDFTNKGFAPPRMTTTQRDSIAIACSCTPVSGLQIFNTTTNCFEAYIFGRWQSTYCGCDGAPGTPGDITGTAAVCASQSGVSYTIQPVSGAVSYSWTVPSGAVITSGQGTVSITVTFASTSGNVSVAAVNNCGASAPNNLAVTITSPPAAAGTITGTADVCTGQSGVSYSVPAISGATGYTWSYSGSGATISGNTNPVTINFSGAATSGNLTVMGTNTCGNGTVSANYPVTLHSYASGSQTFTYNGAIQELTIPYCVTSITIEAWGAEGGGSLENNNARPGGGKGGYIYGTKTVTPGTKLYVYVGGKGVNGTSGHGGEGGWNGGGNGSTFFSPEWAGGGGGGASDVRYGDTTLASRIIVAGGGGGGGDQGVAGGGYGGGGGYPSGGNGSGGSAGSGGTQSAGGAAGGSGTAGVSGYGGNGQTGGNADGGGGGGGYFGGGGSGGSGQPGGGGGSSYFGGMTSATGYTNNTWSGNGKVVISW